MSRSRSLLEQFAPTAEEEAQKINDQTDAGLVTDQAFWEKMGIRTGEELAKSVLSQTYSDYYKEINGRRPRGWPQGQTLQQMSVDDIQQLIDGLDEQASDEWYEERHQMDQELGEPGWEDDMMAAVENNPEDIPEEWKEYEQPTQSGMGRRTESKMKITVSQVRQIIKEEIRRAINEYRPNTSPGNLAPDRDSNWSQFAAELDIGTLDLDEMAYTLGFRDFADMDISITPRALADRDSKSFIDAAQAHSMAAEDMSPDQILTFAGASGGV